VKAGSTQYVTGKDARPNVDVLSDSGEEEEEAEEAEEECAESEDGSDLVTATATATATPAAPVAALVATATAPLAAASVTMRLAMAMRRALPLLVPKQTTTIEANDTAGDGAEDAAATALADGIAALVGSCTLKNVVVQAYADPTLPVQLEVVDLVFGTLPELISSCSADHTDNLPAMPPKVLDELYFRTKSNCDFSKALSYVEVAVHA